MWQAISRLLSEQLGEGEIELRNELPGGEVHAAWHLRYAGHDFFVKCDERELLPGFTAEADQLELLSRSKTVTVPKVWAVGADRDYSFLVMDYLPPRPLDAHSAFILGQQIARLHQWSDQPQFGLDFDNALSTTPQPNTWQRRWSTFFAEQRIGWQLELAAEKGIAFGNIDAIVEHIQQRLASHQPQPSLLHGDLWSGNCALGPDGPYIFDPACYWGDRECDLAMLPLHTEQPPQIYDGYQSVSPLPADFLERQPQFGLDFDNALSTTPQPNTWQRRWSTFFAEQRIGWQLELAAEKGIAFGNIDAIVEHIQQRLASHQPQPSLLHGDLWSGNCALGPDGPYIFDPACYWGDRECDLAMLPLHTEQPPQIYDGYQSVSPLPADFLERQPVYQLYTLLNRARLFGGQHLVIAQQSLDRLLAA